MNGEHPDSPSRPVERMRELEARGVRFSRNANFELFEEPDNRRALDLYRYLDALADQIREAHDEGDLAASVEERDEETVLLRLRREELAVSQMTALHREELRALTERRGVVEALQEAGASL